MIKLGPIDWGCVYSDRKHFELDYENKTYMLLCGHRYHKKCLDSHESQKLYPPFKCPLCRQVYLTKDVCGKQVYNVNFKYHYHI